VEPEGLADAFPLSKRAMDQKASSQSDEVFFFVCPNLRTSPHLCPQKKKPLLWSSFLIRVDLTELFSNQFVEGLEIICLVNVHS
jgi:hypothetical protein